MGRLIATEYVSLDGVFEGPGGGDEFEHSGWTFRIDRGDAGNAFKLDETMETDALLFGRTTYRGMAEVWPHMTGEFADRWNTLPKFVVSSTLRDGSSWTPTTVLTGPLDETIPALVESIDGNIVIHGSGQLVRALLDLQLIDELRLMTFPVVLGSGRRLLESGHIHRMWLVDTTIVGDGIVISTYEPELHYTVSADFPAPVERVWHAWTDPVSYGEWFRAVPGSVDLDVRPGGEWRLDSAGTDGEGPERLSGRYLEVEPHCRLVMTARFGEAETTMTIDFEPDGDQTTLRISQDSRQRAEHEGGRAGSELLLGWCAEYLARPDLA
jgi:uncharacterized protein YndB with AHSA1/START domain/dihydrofolate reductase